MRLHRIRIPSITLCLAILVCACSNSNEDPLPVYLHIDNPAVIINESANLKSTLGIRDIWLDYGSNSLAAFRMPVIIPLLLENGVDSVLLRGGIFESGLSSTRSPYPFWKPQNYFVADIQPLDTLHISPVFSYLPRDSVLAYPFEEGFENASLILEPLRTGINSIRIEKSISEPFEGSASGRIRFSDSEYDFEYVATDYIALPQSGNNDIYVELTYKNDISFTLGFYYALGQQINITETGIFFNSDLEWNTVFVHVNDQLRAIPSGARFKLFFRANSLNQETGRGKTGNIFLDNLRIVHFK